MFRTIRLILATLACITLTVIIFVMGSLSYAQGQLPNDPSGRIVVSSNRTGNYQLYIMSPDGSQSYRLTNNAFNDTSPTWSSDGSRVAFVSDRDGNSEIYVIDSQTLMTYRLTDSPSSDTFPSWSPTNDQIAFVSERDGNAEIYVMEIDGENLHRLTFNPGMDGFPSWSPDGAKIIFSSERTNPADIFVMDANGENQTNLTNTPDIYELRPVWSPATEEIMYILAEQQRATVYYSLAKMRSNGTDHMTIAHEDFPDWIESAIWSPDGRRVALTTIDSFDSSAKLHVIEMDGGYPKELDNEVSDGIVGGWSVTALQITLMTTPTPTLTPTPKPLAASDGMLAFSSNESGNFEVYVMNADGTDWRNLTFNNADDLAPVFSPDGRHLAFSSNRNNSWGEDNVYIADFDGRNPRPLLPEQIDDNGTDNPYWSPDNRTVVFNTTGFDRFIYAASIDDNEPRRIGGGTLLSLSPDGQFIATFLRYTGPELLTANGELYSYLALDYLSDNRIAWSPDSQQIAFASTRTGNAEIFVMNIDGSNLQQITDNPSDDYSPAWSTDGRFIAFISNREGNPDIYVMDANGANVRRITMTSAEERSPVWLPAGVSYAESEIPTVVPNIIVQPSETSSNDSDSPNEDALSSNENLQSDASVSNGCPTAPSRLSVGQLAVANDNLRVRSGPGTANPQVQDLGTGSVVSIINGPACADNARWWEISTQSGNGWVVEIIEPYNTYLLLPNGSPLGADNNRWDGNTSSSNNCPGALTPRMQVGQRGRVTFTDGSPTNLRSAPAASRILTAMREGYEFDVVGGPECHNGLNWWQLRTNDGLTGWAAEGKEGDNYWIEPLVGRSGSESSEELIAGPPSDSSPSQCYKAMSPLFAIGDRGQVAIGDGIGSHIQTQPAQQPDLIYLNEGDQFDIVGGPSCANGFRWWQVRVQGITGWIAEGDEYGYWLEK